MIFTLNLVMIGLLFSIFYEDMKERKVTLMNLLLLIVIGGFIHSHNQYLEAFLISSILNLSIVLIILGLLFFYAMFKLNTSLFLVFGIGDGLFFIVMALSFPTTTFVVLLLSSFIFSLIISLLFKKKLKQLIPLAGLQALFTGITIGTNQLFHCIDLYTF